MKKRYAVAFFSWLLSVIPAASQTTTPFVGTWEGILNVGQGLKIVFHIRSDTKGSLVSTADSPDQGGFGLKCDSTYLKDGGIVIEMNKLNAAYSGKLVGDSILQGVFVQGMEFPLTLKKLETPTERKRPQNPQPPFPYRSEDVVYYNKDRSIQFGATLTIPEGKGPFPAIVLITGSGPQNRDEELFGHKPFAVLADHLSRKGYMVLRYDDRGVGKTTGQFIGATSADFAKDVHAGLDFILGRFETNKKKIGLIGHSEGAMIAPMAAAERNDLDFIVLLAGPGIDIPSLLAEQNIAIARTKGVGEDALKEFAPLFKSTILTIMNSQDSLSAIQMASMTMESWAVRKSPALLSQLNFTSPANRAEYVKALVAELQIPWFRYFVNFKTRTYLQKLSCKVLALNGEKDIQVLPASNLSGIRNALKLSRSRIFEIKELPGLNHLFQTCNKCDIEEYVDLEESFSPVALMAITDWLDKYVK